MLQGVRSEFCGGQTDKVPEYQKPPWKLAEEIITGKTDDYLEDYRILVAGCAGRSRSRKNLADSDTAGVEDEGASRSTEGMATPPRPHYPSFPSRVCCTWPETGRSAGGGRQNVEITQLFRQAGRGPEQLQCRAVALVQRRPATRRTSCPSMR